jgi:hypothetical protein
MTDETQIAVCNMIYLVTNAVMFVMNKDLTPLLWLRMVQMAIKCRMCSVTPSGFADYACLLGHMQEIEEACRFGELSLQLAQKYGDPAQIVRVQLTYHFITHHWKHSVHSAIDPLFHGYTAGISLGETHAALMCALCYCWQYDMAGLSLVFVENDVQNFISVMREYNFKAIVDMALPLWQKLLKLMGKNDTEDPTVLTGSVMDEVEYLREMDEIGNNRGKATMLAQRLKLLTYFGHDRRAVDTYRIVRGFKKELLSHFGSIEEDFHGCLSALALSKEQRMGEWYRRFALRIIRRFKNYVNLGAINVVHMLQLLEADYLSLKRKKSSSWRQEVKRAYELAINSAKRSGFLQHAALANEKAATFHKSFDPDYAKAHLDDAFQLYVEWGAVAKLNQLVELHPSLGTISRASTGAFSSASSGCMKARKRYNEETAGQYKQINFW